MTTTHKQERNRRRKSLHARRKQYEQAMPEIVRVIIRARGYIREFRDEMFDCVTVRRDPSTMCEDDRAIIERADSRIAELDSALAKLDAIRRGEAGQ